MSEIQKVSATPNFQSSHIKKGEVKPNDTGLKSDETNFSKGKKRAKKFALVYLGACAVGSAAALAVMIGRNPAKAAKVLKGNSEFANEVYKKGDKFAEEIMNKKGDFKTTLDTVLDLFRPPKNKTGLGQNISDAEKFIQENNITPDEDTAKAFTSLKKNLKQYTDSMEQKYVDGADLKTYDIQQKFRDDNADSIKKISDFLIHNNADFGLSSSFSRSSADVALRPNITECPKEILPNDGVFFHGTHHARQIYKTGFTNHASNQIDKFSRELGAGVYVTPDIGVASYFSGLFGNIIPVTLSKDAKIALITEKDYPAFVSAVNAFGTERIGADQLKGMDAATKNATFECLTKRIMQAAGYDAAYIPKGVKAGGDLFSAVLNPNINDVIGKKQSQLVIFSPDKMEIAPRTLKQRVSDVGEKFAALKRTMDWQK